MISLNIQDIEPGMVLGAEVKDRTGRVLLSKGTTVTEKHLSIFKMWGVVDAIIENADKEKIEAKAVADIEPGDFSQAQEEMDRVFRFVEQQDHPFIIELKRLGSIRIAQKKAASV
ncbi:MAG TPA: hypothetical protein VK470_17605 [Bacteroidota bacterium]|nr:hypothetical protein [Bacteroidota bacterium]